LVVGIFVLVIAIGLGAVLLFLGAATRLFTERSSVSASFSTVGGLRQGASVLLAGVTVGTVTSVRLAAPGEGGARVELGLSSEARRRLRADATATLQTVGLLGDRVIAIEPGQAEAPLPRGAVLPGNVPLELGDVITKIGDTVDALTKLALRLDETVAHIDVPGIAENVRVATDGLKRIVTRVEHGPGLLHDLAYDAALAEELRAAGEQIQSASRQLAAAGAGSNTMVRRLDDAAANIDQIVAHVRAGRGTLGGIVYDPDIYENLKIIVGNVRRSLILRTLARFALRHMSHD
jgi:phospholipid/cholesterol/gamma-HCH transport system substrate-binding protein